MNKQVIKTAVPFARAEAALQAAEGKYPTDVVIAIGGDAKRPSRYVFGEVELREMLEQSAFGTHPHDKVHIWLPA